MDNAVQSVNKGVAEIQKVIDLLTEFFIRYSFNILGAIVILIIGFWIANQAALFVAKLLQKKNIDVTLAQFTANVVKIIILAFAVMMALEKFGITITPFIAALSGAAFGASFAFQGPLMNYGAGLSIILSRPFVIGDTITVQGVSGVVESIKLAMTAVVTEDGVRVTVPNKHIVGEIIHNSKKFNIVEKTVGISYTDDPRKAIDVIRRSLEGIPEVSQSPKPQIGIAEFGDSSITIGMRYWVPTTNYYYAMYGANLQIFDGLIKAGITIPFPQREVRVLSEKTENGFLKEARV